jgi:hypothetical protein
MNLATPGMMTPANATGAAATPGVSSPSGCWRESSLPDGALSLGIYCTIELHIPRKTPSYKLSADAIIFNEAGSQVAVVENGVVHLRKVAVVRGLGQAVEVNSGVKRGDQVILNPAVDLADGSKVRTRPQPTQASWPRAGCRKRGPRALRQF